MRFTNTITIDRPLSQVFAYLADLENLPRWNYAIGATRKITAGPIDVGSRYLQTRTIPVHTEEHLEIIEFEPDHRLTIRGSLNSLPAQVTYTLRAEEDVTFLTNTVDLQPPRLLKLVAPVATLRTKSAVAANLAVLKRTLEQE